MDTEPGRRLGIISGHMVKDVEPGNVTAVRTFDTMGRLMSVVGMNPDTTNGQNASRTFDYDEFGRLRTLNSFRSRRAHGPLSTPPLVS